MKYDDRFIRCNVKKMLNVFPDKQFIVPIYSIITNTDGIDEEVVIGANLYDCRITELSTKDVQVLNGVADKENNTRKLYTNNDIATVEEGDKIIFN